MMLYCECTFFIIIKLFLSDRKTVLVKKKKIKTIMNFTYIKSFEIKLF